MMNLEEIAESITEYYFACEDYSEDELYLALQEAGEREQSDLAVKIVSGAVYMAIESLVHEEGNELLKSLLEIRKSENWKFPNP